MRPSGRLRVRRILPGLVRAPDCRERVRVCARARCGPAFEPAPVFVPPAAAGPVATGGTMPLPEYPPESQPPAPEELAQRQLERARMSLASRRLEAEYVVEVGDPAERLVDVADQREADLIVVGSREPGFLERLLGHGIDEAVARRADRDVLLVH